MTRDTFDFMDDNRRQRERHGDDESVRGNDSARSNLVELSLTFRLDKPLSIAVSKPGEHKWHWLPKSKIEFEISGTEVIVTMPAWLAKDKGLV